MGQEKLLSKKKGYSVFAILGILCAFLWKAERDLAESGNIIWTGKYLISIILFSVLVGAILGMAICYLTYGLLEHRWSETRLATKVSKITKWGPFSGESQVSIWKVFFGSFALTLLCWIPCYLAYFPGICSYDTIIQLEQIVTGNYIDHHPILHTLCLRWAIQFGEALFHNATVGVGVYVALQMMFVALAFSYGVWVLMKCNASKWGVLLVQLFAMFYPFHWYMSVTTTKDTLFSAFFLVQMVSLYGWIVKRGEQCKRDKSPLFLAIMFVISTTFMIVFRNNGKYAMLVLLLFSVLTVLFGKRDRKGWMLLLGCALAGFVMGSAILSGLFKATNATQGDKREMLSMPIQQLSRTMLYHGGVGMVDTDDDSLSQEEKAIINEFLLNESYKLYRPEISDPVKRNTNTYVVRYRAKEFVSTYLELLFRYPGEYINAALAVNAGFLSPGDVTHASINETEGIHGMGYVQTHWAESELGKQGIYKDSKWQSMHHMLEEWADENAYLRIPILKYLFVPGMVLWAYLLLFGVLLLKRRYANLLPLSLVLGYFGTLLLGPTVQLRYIYPLMIVLPFLYVLCVGSQGKEKE